MLYLKTEIKNTLLSHKKIEVSFKSIPNRFWVAEKLWKGLLKCKSNSVIIIFFAKENEFLVQKPERQKENKLQTQQK
jgi:hypothetical protein